MSELCILICRRDDPASSTLTELARFDLPSPDLSTLQPATTLDDLEATTLTTGMSVLRRLLQLAWEQLDAALVAQYRAAHPTQRLPADGSEPLTVVSRFGTLPLRRQVLADRAHLAALGREQIRPPQGVSWADWERVLAARRAEREVPVEELRHLGPRLAADEVLLSVDEVLTPKTDGSGRWELRTAVLATAQGERYLSGTGAAFLPVVRALARVAVGADRRLLLLSDGARWIRTFFTEQLSPLPGAQHLLDWYHLEQKCRDLASRICRDKEAKGVFLRRLYRRLWVGQVHAAVQWLEGYRPPARNTAVLDELIGYLQARVAWIPNYRQRRRARQYIGSGHVEKANDRLVARRQKRKGMHWSLASSDSLAALRTVLLNGGWDTYWAERRVLPLVAEAA